MNKDNMKIYIYDTEYGRKIIPDKILIKTQELNSKFDGEKLNDKRTKGAKYLKEEMGREGKV